MLNFSVRKIARHETSMLRFVLLLFFEWMAIACCSAQVVPYAGILGGLATLSADARSQLTAQGLNASLYKPGNGRALNLFGGANVTQYLSLQANYIWNRNDLILSSTSSASNCTVPHLERISLNRGEAFCLSMGLLDLLLDRRRSSGAWVVTSHEEKDDSDTSHKNRDCNPKGFQLFLQTSGAAPKNKVRQKNSWVDSGSGSLPSE
jgi:hypothetical protein